MKSFKYIALCMLALCSWACNDDVIEKINEVYPDHTTYYYYSFFMQHKLDSETTDKWDAGDLQPGAVCVKGDTVFVANKKEGRYGVWLFDKKKQTVIGKIDTRISNEMFESSLDEMPLAVAAGNERIYVAAGHYIHVYDDTTLKPLFFLGNGTWSMIDRPSAMVYADNKLFVREKRAIYTIDALKLTVANLGEMPVINKSGELNPNYHYTHAMALGKDNRVYVTNGYENKMYSFDPKLVNETTAPNLRIVNFTLPFAPIAFGMYENFACLAGNNTIKWINTDEDKEENDLRNLGEYKFDTVAGMALDGDSIFATDTKQEKLIHIGIVKTEIKEFK